MNIQRVIIDRLGPHLAEGLQLHLVGKNSINTVLHQIEQEIERSREDRSITYIVSIAQA